MEGAGVLVTWAVTATAEPGNGGMASTGVCGDVVAGELVQLGFLRAPDVWSAQVWGSLP